MINIFYENVCNSGNSAKKVYSNLTVIFLTQKFFLVNFRREKNKLINLQHLVKVTVSESESDSAKSGKQMTKVKKNSSQNSYFF